MPTQSGGYYVDGVRVPSVTTVLGRFKESGGLVHWAWNLGKQGKDYRTVRDEAASAGTVAHAMVEAHLRGQSEISTNATPEVYALARNAFVQFREWSLQTSLKVIATETPLISKVHKFGGTLDAVAIQGETSILDWKSSNSVYPEYMAQIAAYGLLWNENNPDNPITGGYHLVRFDKVHAAFSHHWWGDLSVPLDYFLILRRAYDLQAVMKRMAG